MEPTPVESTRGRGGPPPAPRAFREETDPMPAPTPEQHQAFARILTHANRLFEALEDLAAAGGLRGLSGRIKPASIAKAAAALRSVRQAIDEQLAGVKE